MLAFDCSCRKKSIHQIWTSCQSDSPRLAVWHRCSSWHHVAASDHVAASKVSNNAAVLKISTEVEINYTKPQHAGRVQRLQLSAEKLHTRMYGVSAYFQGEHTFSAIRKDASYLRIATTPFKGAGKSGNSNLLNSPGASGIAKIMEWDFHCNLSSMSSSLKRLIVFGYAPCHIEETAQAIGACVIASERIQARG